MIKQPAYWRNPLGPRLWCSLAVAVFILRRRGRRRLPVNPRFAKTARLVAWLVC
jgi:hypothetical protein